jgi:hypothetical protein
MKILKKATLSILAALPVSTISIAAHSELLNIAGEEMNSKLPDELMSAKRLLFPPGVITTTEEQARAQIQNITGESDPEKVDEIVRFHIQKMLESGMIETNEHRIISKIPSW